MTGFLLSQLTFLLFGAPAAVHPSVRPLGWPARIAAAFGLGAIALTLEAILFSMFGLRWGNRTMAIPLLVLSAALSWRWSGRPASPRRPFKPGWRFAIVAGMAILITLIIFIHRLVLGSATSVDLVLFEGTKAVRFAVAKGFDANFLRSPFSAHTHPNAPPLFPMTLSWYALGREEPMWTWAPLTAALWLTASIPLVLELLRRRLDDTVALAATAFWTVAMAIDLLHAHSAGNADAAWLFYGTIAFAALLTDRKSDTAVPIAAAALAGLALTKPEGLLFSMVLVSSFAVTSLADSRSQSDSSQQRLSWRWMAILLSGPLVTFALWNGFLMARHLPLHDPAAGTFALWSVRWWEAIAATEVVGLHSGTWALTVLIPFAVLLLNGRNWNGAVLSGVLVISAAVAMTTTSYMKEWNNPTELVAATFPHFAQWPASVLILTACFAYRRHEETVRPEVP